MSFHESASHIELVDGHILRALLRTENGDEEESTIDLDHHIGNDNGMLLCLCLAVPLYTTIAPVSLTRLFRTLPLGWR